MLLVRFTIDISRLSTECTYVKGLATCHSFWYIFRDINLTYTIQNRLGINAYIYLDDSYNDCLNGGFVESGYRSKGDNFV